MAHLFSDCLGEVDVITNAENIKRLLKLPYASNCSISMMVHRIENTLLIDDFDVHRFLLQQEDCNWQWLRSFIYENVLSRLNDTDRNVQNKPSTSLPDAVQQRSLLSKFLYHSLLSSPGATPDTKQMLDVEVMPQPKQLPYRIILPEPNIEENIPDPKHTKHTYNRNVVWTFEDIRMLIGTDMAIFGDSTRPCISLRLRDMCEPINVLTGIDYWLDNLMCNVPEVVMCYHLDGLVQKYEIVKTEDLPFLENSEFSPNIIRNVAQNILSFLKQNATKSGHTYWLFKGRKDDVVKLYDLTSLCTNGEYDTNAPKPTQVDMNASEDKNPFTVPVAMLLYKVARNMKNGTERIKPKSAGSIKALLENCIKLLSKEQYPQIVTSSYYLLSDLQVPSETDPMSPKFENKAADADSMYDYDANNSDDSSSGGSAEERQEETVNEETILVSDITKQWAPNKLPTENVQPLPLTGSVDERCSHALQYIISGLNCLQHFSMNAEKLSKQREESEKNVEKIRIIEEEQNPVMAKPYEPIPLPYEQIKTEPGTSKANQDENKLKLNEKLQPNSGVQSWNIHLKLLLLEKSCLIYATLTEQEYQRGKYGSALKFIALAFKCFNIVTYLLPSFKSIGTNYRTNLLGRAGDCYFQCAQHFDDIDNYVAEFNNERKIDLAVEKELQVDLKAAQSKSGVEIQRPVNNLEQLILNSISCYELALQYADGKDSRLELLGRIGSVRNELGVKYMHWSQDELESSYKSQKPENDPDDKTKPASDPIYLTLAMKSYDSLIRGIAAFEEIQDNANLAILLCNMGRLMRLRAHLGEENDFNFKKVCYNNAFASYERALATIEARKRNSGLWDVVTWELLSGKFTLGKHILEHFKNQMVRPTMA